MVIKMPNKYMVTTLLLLLCCKGWHYFTPFRDTLYTSIVLVDSFEAYKYSIQFSDKYQKTVTDLATKRVTLPGLTYIEI